MLTNCVMHTNKPLSRDEMMEVRRLEGEAWEEPYLSDPSRFELGEISLELVIRTMREMGMVREAEAPELPEPDDFGLGDYPSPAELRVAGDVLTRAEQAFLDERTRLRLKEADVNAIPSYKMYPLTEDDSWVISEREMRGALYAHGESSEMLRLKANEMGEWWGRLIHFFQGVPNRGGMFVMQ